jgi:hypothetical protein
MLKETELEDPELTETLDGKPDVDQLLDGRAMESWTVPLKPCTLPTVSETA